VSDIEIVNWDALGYEKLGPKNPDDKNRTDQMRTALQSHLNYEVQADKDTVWIRDFRRKKGAQITPLLSQSVLFDSGNFQDEQQYKFFDSYLRSVFAEAHRVNVPVFEFQQCVKALKRIVDEPISAATLHSFAIGLFFSKVDSLPDLLRKYALPFYFERFPDGRFAVVCVNEPYESMYASLRGGLAMELYSYDEIAQRESKGFGTLKGWHYADTTTLPSLFMNLAAFAFYPRMHSFFTGPLGLLFGLITEPPLEQVPPVYPQSWLDMLESKAEFARSDKAFKLTSEGAEYDRDPKVVHQRYLHSGRMTVAETVAFIEWLIERYNELILHLTDPAEIVTDGFVDFTSAFEHSQTVDRILREAVSCLTAGQVNDRILAAMEVADLLESLRTFWVPADKDKWFKTLFNPTHGKSLVKACLVPLLDR
jgi:hypothetical protein